ncbi:MAG: HAMP domain-containing histidine kinase [Nannocystaceae bacterium]|nr:HAMP domain-containing histidine kinase [Nannocystaceae bacterium]
MTVAPSQLRAVGTAFLLKRPIIVAPGMVLGLTMLVVAGVPSSQVVALAVCLTLMFSLFCIEAWYGRATPVSERWLAWSLRITLTALTVACALSGGLRSPFLPLVLAPVVVAFAAFGRGPASTTMAAYFALLVFSLSRVPVGWPWPPIPSPFDMGMTAVTSIITLVLAYVGVAQLSDTLVSSRESLLRVRQDALLAATDRLKSLETIGAKLAHELNNPLASIKGLAQLSARSSEDPRTQKRFDVLLTAVRQMEDIVDGYLSFSRPLASLDAKDLDLDLLVVDAVELVRTGAHSRGVAIVCEGAAGDVHADRRRLLDAVLNIVTNAVEASSRGSSVRVLARRVAQGVEIEVCDSGPGLSASELKRLGTPYFTTKAHGTGLGVVIAMASIRQHGGELRYESLVGRGTTATITLPARPALESDPCPP